MRYINEPCFPELLRQFLYDQINPDAELHSHEVPLAACPDFNGHIAIFHSTVAHFYAPSDLCGIGGMYQERIRSNPSWYGQYARRDTVFVETDANLPGMRGMVIGRVYMFFSFTFQDTYYPCALVHWFVPIYDRPDETTGMWVVCPEFDADGTNSLVVIHLDCIVCRVLLVGVCRDKFLPEGFHFSDSLDAFHAFYINKYADHHTNEFI